MPTRLPNTKIPHASGNVFDPQSQHAKAQQPLRGVGQDKDMPKFQRVATKQPDPVKTLHRANPLNNDIYRSQNNFTGKLRAVKATTWLNPLVKNELERTAGLWGVSLSKVMATALEEWVHQSIHAQHDAMLYPMMRKVIREELRTFGNRIVFFLMRIAFAAEQTRILITNVLDRILRREGVPENTLARLVDQSNTLAKRNIIKKTPQLKSLLEEWEASFRDGKEEDINKNYG